MTECKVMWMESKNLKEDLCNLREGSLGVVEKYMYEVVGRLSRWSGCDVDKKEMIEYLKEIGYRIEVDLVKGKSKCIIPFCGSKISGRCSGIKLNYGLYSQCMNEISEKDVYCKTCSKQGVKSGTGKPTYGDISERIDRGKEWRDKKGKEAVRYRNVMDKLEISRERAEKEAERFGLKIPEIEFEIKEVKRGRPKKSVEVSDTDSEKSQEPKKRGRPRKDKQVVSSLSPGDDLIAGLIKSAKEFGSVDVDDSKKNDGVNVDVKCVKDEDEDEDEDEEEVEVEKFIDPKSKIEYYKTEDNILYSMDSEPVGRWNPETEEIEKILDLEEDDD